MRFLLIPLLVSLSTAALSAADIFAGSAPFREIAAKGVRNERLDPVWLDQGARLWFRTVTAEGSGEYQLVDASTGARQPLFDHTALRSALTRAGVPAETVNTLRLENVQPDPAAQSIAFTLAGSPWTWQADSGDLNPGPPAAAGTSPPVPRASISGGPDMNLTIRNETAGRINLWWLDPAGRRQPYGRIPAGGTSDQHTFAGHVWLITDTDGKELTAFEKDWHDYLRKLQPDGSVRK